MPWSYLKSIPELEGRIRIRICLVKQRNRLEFVFWFRTYEMMEEKYHSE